MRTVTVRMYRGRVETLAGWDVSRRYHVLDGEGAPVDVVETVPGEVLAIGEGVPVVNGVVYRGRWEEGVLLPAPATGVTVLAKIDTWALGLPTPAPGTARVLERLLGRPTRRPGVPVLGPEGRRIVQMGQDGAARGRVVDGAFYEATVATVGAWDALAVVDRPREQAPLATLGEALGGPTPPAPCAPALRGVLVYRAGQALEWVSAPEWTRWQERFLPKRLRPEAADALSA